MACLLLLRIVFSLGFRQKRYLICFGNIILLTNRSYPYSDQSVTFLIKKGMFCSLGGVFSCRRIKIGMTKKNPTNNGKKTVNNICALIFENPVIFGDKGKKKKTQRNLKSLGSSTSVGCFSQINLNSYKLLKFIKSVSPIENPFLSLSIGPKL